MTTGTYSAISSPASVENVEETLQCIYEASSLSRLLASVSDCDGNAMDDDAMSEIGNTLTRLLSQPMECTGKILSEKRDAADKASHDSMAGGDS